MKSKESQIYGIIGNSLSHTLSPDIYDYLYKKHRLSCVYKTFEIQKDYLSAAIKSIKAIGISGVNVTFPFKNDIIKYLDELDRPAGEIGAVNLVKRVNSRLIGYNTDIDGIDAVLTERLKIAIDNTNIIILGAGGAAREALYVLLRHNPRRLFILNRNIRKAKLIARALETKAIETEIITGNISGRPRTLFPTKIDLIINATSAPPILIKSIIRQFAKTDILEDVSFFDLNYGPRAVQNKLPAQITKREDGLFMLAVQASINFLIWHGIKTDTNGIHQFLKRIVKRK